MCSQLFGEEDPDQDVSPDTADPELAGKHDCFKHLHARDMDSNTKVVRTKL